MNQITKLQLINKARYIYGLANILKCDIDMLRKDINDMNEERIRESIANANDILDKLSELVNDLDVILNLD